MSHRCPRGKDHTFGWLQNSGIHGAHQSWRIPLTIWSTVVTVCNDWLNISAFRSLSLSHTHTHTHTHNTTHKCTLWKSADFINVTICYLWFSLEFESLHLQEVHISGSGRSKVCLSFERTYFMYSFLRMFITVILKPVGIFRYLAFAKYTPQYVVRMNMCWPADWPLASQKQLFFTDSRSWVQQREHFF